MSVINVDMSGVNKKLDALTLNRRLGLFAASEAARLMQPYVPEREGILKNSPANNPRPWIVTYDTPYARAMYEGVVRGRKVRYTKPTAISHWDKGINVAELAQALTSWIRVHL